MRLELPFTRLESETALPEFDCGDEDLNEFFAIDAIKWQNELLSVAYYLEANGKAILYFSLANDKIPADTLPKNFWRKIKVKFPHSKHRKDYLSGC